MDQYILTIDRGSTNIKVVLFNKRLEQVYMVSAPNAEPIADQEGWREFDLDYAWQQACELIQQVLANFCTAGQIMAVSFSAHGNGLILLGEDKRPVMNGIYSLDSRAAGIFDAWQVDGLFDKAVEELRFPFQSGSTMPLFAWVKQNKPELLEKARHLIYPKDWLRYCFTGELATDYTDASGTGILSHEQQTFPQEVFELLGIAELSRLLPPLRHSHEQAGTVTAGAAETSGLLQGTPVIVGGHDICVCPAGITDTSEKVLISTFGTWSVSVMNATDTEQLPVVMNHALEGSFLTGVGDGNAGAALDTMLRLCFADKMAESEKSGASIHDWVERSIAASDRNALLFVPHLFGNIFNPVASSSMLGLRGHTDRLEILKALCEGILLGYRANIELLPPFQFVDKIWLTGGGGRGNLLGQVMADIFEREVYVSEECEMSARGAAVCAMIGLKQIDSVSEARAPRIRKIFTPDPEMFDYYRRKMVLLNKVLAGGDSILSQLDELQMENTCT